jgi:PHD/YefM family antitoxin component YafN of YafNO toxin-antitoxin module
MHVSATQAKNQFGAMCSHAKTAPVFVEKDGRVDTVILSAKHYAELRAAGAQSSMAQRRKAFEHTYKTWLDAQNAQVEKNGLWCDDLRVW